METNTTEERLTRLLENQQWPLRYMFKFIVPNRDGNVDKVNQLMPSNGKLSYKHTPNLQYVSITCEAQMHSAEEIVGITSRVVAIPGAMAL
ncbi:MAG: DUF493 family protein [Marinilabiliaceae bacterium]|nr:DUF493 family protein [Marinilabiliaceae bacterium]